ncbi:MAG: peptide/nickel transport system substrate-binding protein [Solirubrobacteraceae bacterium]|nr:peptide/nickel transport system substrate-binding protein [Solirubrobacteraceae bacterium]
MHRISGALTLIAIAALTASGCGGGNGSGSKGTGKRGGELTILSTGDIQSLDPGASYYGYDYQVIDHPTQRGLYGWKPSDTTPTPDLATAMPKTSADGKTVTITIRPNIRYSPPLQNRKVTSADVKYAIERTFLPSVGNGYSALYYNRIVGSKAFGSGKASDISGIQTPNATTLVLKLADPVGVISNAQALSLPGTAPVPQDYAQRYDRKKKSDYGEHQVFTGPYMVRNDGKGTITGYRANRSIELVRNPSWDPKSDFRPALLDKITVQSGNTIDVASRRILSGQSLINGDFATPSVNVLRSALSTRTGQLDTLPAASTLFISLNTTIKPFDNVNVRRAASAVIDRNALRLTRGGPTLGTIATHFIPPGLIGFKEAGGTSAQVDFLKNPSGDLALAQRYMRKAGYPSGRYKGPPLRMIGDDQAPNSNTGEAVREQLGKLGLTFDYRKLARDVTFDQYCGNPRAHVAVCPNGGWIKDFFDPQSMLDPNFSGSSIFPDGGSTNWSFVDDPELNASLETAAAEVDPERRARAYADIDRTVTENAYVIPWLWDNQINIRSDNVRSVSNTFTGAWDLSFTSVK